MPRLFGTQGFRGLVNVELTGTVAHDIGRAMAHYLGQEKTVGIGWDSRISSEMLGLAFSAGLMGGGCNVQVLGLVPTPLLSYAIPRLKFDGGVMVTASHNPPEFNGIKLWGADGASYTAEMEGKIENFYFASEKSRTPWQKCGRSIPLDDYRPQYTESLVKQVNRKRLVKRQFRLVADCGGGAASSVVPMLLKLIDTKTELLFCKPDGFFKNRLPEPTQGNLTKLIRLVKEKDVDMGMAWDGDGDRIVLVSESGRYLMGDRTFALVAFHRLRDWKEKPKRIVTQVATSDVIRDVAQIVDAELIETSVGEPNIVTTMKQKNAQIGGEENGGVIYRGWSWTREGMLTALLILDFMAAEDKSLEELDAQFPSYFQVKEKVACPNELKPSLLARVASLAPTDAECETLDGVKLRYSDGWVLFRPSGTEPIFRVFAEAKTKSRAKTLIENGLSLVEDALEEIKSSSKKLLS
ncbi:MAG: phosphoglucosamine mutase [Candidatus Hermodarchaeia archaeon]|jgi:phosphomannomutase/phosphoglucomutase